MMADPTERKMSGSKICSRTSAFRRLSLPSSSKLAVSNAIGDAARLLQRGHHAALRLGRDVLDRLPEITINLIVVQQAEDALKTLEKRDMDELKAYPTPPEPVRLVMAAVLFVKRIRCWSFHTSRPSAKVIVRPTPLGEPSRAWLEYQDWGTPWTRFYDADQSTLLAYASHFIGG